MIGKIRRSIGRILYGAQKRNRDRFEGERIQVTNAGQGKNLRFDVIGNDIQIQIGTHSVLNGTLIFVRGNNQRISIGSSSYIGPGELWIEDDGGTIIINDLTTVQSGHFAVTEGCSIELGNDCMLSDDVEIRTGDSHSIIDVNSNQRINHAASVILEAHVWVGAHARILKGTRVGANSIIGNSSVVSLEVPSNSIAAGIPARIVKTGINWKRERI